MSGNKKSLTDADLSERLLGSASTLRSPLDARSKTTCKMRSCSKRGSGCDPPHHWWLTKTLTVELQALQGSGGLWCDGQAGKLSRIGPCSSRGLDSPGPNQEKPALQPDLTLPDLNASPSLQPPMEAAGGTGLLATSYVGCTDVRRIWRRSGPKGFPGAKFDEHRCNRHSAPRGGRICRPQLWVNSGSTQERALEREEQQANERHVQVNVSWLPQPDKKRRAWEAAMANERRGR